MYTKYLQIFFSIDKQYLEMLNLLRLVSHQEWILYERNQKNGKNNYVKTEKVFKRQKYDLNPRYELQKHQFFHESHMQAKVRPRGKTIEQRVWRKIRRVSWTERKSNKDMLQRVTPNLSLQVLTKMLNVGYSGHIILVNFVSHILQNSILPSVEKMSSPNSDTIAFK